MQNIRPSIRSGRPTQTGHIRGRCGGMDTANIGKKGDVPARATAAGTSIDRQVSTKALAPSCHETLSKSAPRNQQFSSSHDG